MCVSYTLFPSSSPPATPTSTTGKYRTCVARRERMSFSCKPALWLYRAVNARVVSTFNMARTRAVTHERHAQRAKVKRLEIKTRAIHPVPRDHLDARSRGWVREASLLHRVVNFENGVQVRTQFVTQKAMIHKLKIRQWFILITHSIYLLYNNLFI